MDKLNGAKRVRTADPLHAMQVLYQLSYSPECADYCVERINNSDPRRGPPSTPNFAPFLFPVAMKGSHPR